MSTTRIQFLALLFALTGTVAVADDVKPIRAVRPATLGGVQSADSDVSVTQHTVKIDGKTVNYTAGAGYLPLKTEDGKVKAKVFHVIYRKTDTKDATKRPITFCFNGGPGSSSVWLHLGMVGPKRVPMKDDATVTAPPYKLIPNKYSLLDLTDLVLIDPVSTGYSRPAKGEKKSQFHGYDEDIQSVGQFIHAFVTKHRRWGSPKFLLGESYGTTRAAGLSYHLLDRYSMAINGIVQISSVIDFQTIRFGRNNDLPYVLFLPSFTATAWYHKQLPKELQSQELSKVVKQAEKFAIEEYSVALLKGDRLAKKDRRRIVLELARLTGLSTTFIERADLRISMSRFGKELLRKSRRTIGRLDSRYKGIDRDAAGEGYEYDPSNAAIDGPYGATINNYLRTDLKFESDLPYELLTGRVHPWNYKSFTGRYVNVTESLRRAMTRNPHLKVFVANGYYDLATPYFASVYSYNQLRLDPKLRKNISMGYYRAGHMMYVHEPSLKALRGDLVRFYRNTLKR